MIDIVSMRCEYIGYKVIPIFNFHGEKAKRFCNLHKLENMVDVKDKNVIFKDVI